MHVEFERTSHFDLPHQLSVGKNVSLFSNAGNEIQEFQGVIKALNKNTIKIIFPSEELPDWAYDGKLGINTQFDENSYNEMQKALDTVIKARNCRLEELREIIEGTEQLTFENKKLDTV
ncbi:MAG: IGHMBP2 family helicase, partial [Bacteroidia bacterium]|nr:IGHMBP2 family helicase [Bacteroidia bacterium]